MRILIVNTLYAPYKIGGAEKSVQNLAESFVSEGLEVLVLTLGETSEEFELNGVNVKRIIIKNNYWPFNSDEIGLKDKILWHNKDTYNKEYDSEIINHFKEFKPDVLFTNNLAGFSIRIWDLAYSMNIKIVHTLRDYYIQCVKTNQFKKGKVCDSQCLDCLFFSKRKKRGSQKVDAVVGISNFILDNHLNKGLFSNALPKVIYNGFDIKFDDQKVFESKSHLTFGYIGQLNQSKGIEYLLEKLAKIENDNWKLLVAGKINESYQKHLELINNSKNIKFLGFCNSDEFYNLIDVLVVPSLWNEPFGRVVLEAISKRKIVIGAKSGGIPELLENNEAFLFDVDSEELLQIIHKLLNSKLKEKFTFDNTLFEKFSNFNVVSSYIKLFQSLKNKNEG